MRIAASLAALVFWPHAATREIKRRGIAPGRFKETRGLPVRRSRDEVRKYRQQQYLQLDAALRSRRQSRSTVGIQSRVLSSTSAGSDTRARSAVCARYDPVRRALEAGCAASTAVYVNSLATMRGADGEREGRSGPGRLLDAWAFVLTRRDSAGTLRVQPNPPEMQCRLEGRLPPVMHRLSIFTPTTTHIPWCTTAVSKPSREQRVQTGQASESACWPSMRRASRLITAARSSFRWARACSRWAGTRWWCAVDVPANPGWPAQPTRPTRWCAVVRAAERVPKPAPLATYPARQRGLGCRSSAFSKMTGRRVHANRQGFVPDDSVTHEQADKLEQCLGSPPKMAGPSPKARHAARQHRRRRKRNRHTARNGKQ